MEIRQLKYFLNAAKTLNFTKAAELSFVAQSTLSQQIKELENSLKVALFQRVGKKVYLTSEGEAFLPFAQKIINEINDSKQRILDLQELKTGELRIGIAYGINNLLNRALIKFSTIYPFIKIEISYLASDLIPQKILNRELDFALVFNKDLSNDAIKEKTLFKTGLHVVVTKSHALAKKSNISLKELSNYALVLPPLGTSSRNAFEFLQQKYQMHFSPMLESNEFYSILQLIRTENWIGVLADCVIEDEQDLVAIPIAEETVFMNANLLTLNDFYQSKAVTKFLDILESCL